MPAYAVIVRMKSRLDRPCESVDASEAAVSKIDWRTDWQLVCWSGGNIGTSTYTKA